MRTVRELTQDELNELKTALFYEQDASEIFDNDIQYPEQIPNEFVYRHYDDVFFVNDDFFCNTGGQQDEKIS